MQFAGSARDAWELERQNKITQQILEVFLEKKLLLKPLPSVNPPSVWDILPQAGGKFGLQDDFQFKNGSEPEILVSGESERIDSIYDNIGGKYQGRSLESITFLYIRS